MSKKVNSESPEHINARSRVSALSHLSSVNPDLREFLTNKRKLELLQTSPSCCEQVGCQLVMVHSVHYRLGPVPAALPIRQSVFNRLLVRAPAKHQKGANRETDQLYPLHLSTR